MNLERRIYVTKDRQSRLENLLIWYGISIFIFNTIFRKSISQLVWGTSNLFVSINILAIILFYCIFRKTNVSIKSPYGKLSCRLIVVYSILIIFSNFFGEHVEHGHIVLFCTILPGLLMIRYEKINLNFNRILYHFTKYINYAFILIFSLGILDYFLEGVFNLFIALNMSSPEWARMIIGENLANGFRMCTIIGSPLMNGYYACVFLILNAIVYNRFKKSLLPKYFVYIFAIVVIFLTGSRTSLVCAVTFLIVFELKGRINFGGILFLLLSAYTLLNTELFQKTIGQRFSKEDDIRFRLWENLMNGYYGKPKIFQGGGFGYSRYLTGGEFSDTTNFEYPWLMFTFDYGLLATALYYIVIYFIPIVFLLKVKEHILIVGYSAIFLVLQTCNLIAGFYDFNLQFGFLAFLFIGLTYSRNIVL